MTVWYNSAAGITQYSQRSSRLLASANPLQFVSLWFCLSEGGHLKQRGGGREGERERERLWLLDSGPRHQTVRAPLPEEEEESRPRCQRHREALKHRDCF